MKVYAVIEGCDDDYYPDYTILDNRVYLKKEDAEKRLKEVASEYWPERYNIYDFEVSE